MSNSSEEVKSALHASLESKKDQSYYYAHQPRGTGEQRAPEPIHQALRSEIRISEKRVESISTYQFSDCKQTAKVYIPLEKVGDLPEDSIASEFTKESFIVSIENYKADVILRLVVNDLEGEIIPEASRHLQKEDRIIIVLQKALDEDQRCIPWRNLKK